MSEKAAPDNNIGKRKTQLMHEKDEKGRWINYLSGRGLAHSIDVLEQQVREKYMAKRLKDKLGNDFAVLESTSKQAFLTAYANFYGFDWQQELLN